MLIKRHWHRTTIMYRRDYEGWFLFGFLPIYIKASDWYVR